jgi:hypothetical protein
MFSLGEKLRVLNTNADVKIFTGANVELTTVALITAAGAGLITGGGYMTVSGFGKFLFSNMTDFRAARAIAAAVEVADFAVVAPTGVAVGSTIEFRITAKTERYQGELANNYIVGSRPVILQTAPLTGITTANIATAIAAAWTAYVALFVKSTPFFNIAVSGGTNIRSTVVAGYESVSISKMEIALAAQGAGSFPKTSLVRSVITAGTQGRGLGKFLEESIRVSTAENTRAYGLTDAIDTQVDLRGSYTQVNWDLDANYDEPLGNDSSDNMPLANHKFALFLNENTCMDVANGTTSTRAINKIAEAIILVGLPVAAAVAGTTALYSTIALDIAGAGVATTILFTA